MLISRSRSRSRPKMLPRSYCLRYAERCCSKSLASTRVGSRCFVPTKRVWPCVGHHQSRSRPSRSRYTRVAESKLLPRPPRQCGFHPRRRAQDSRISALLQTTPEAALYRRRSWRLCQPRPARSSKRWTDSSSAVACRISSSSSHRSSFWAKSHRARARCSSASQCASSFRVARVSALECRSSSR